MSAITVTERRGRLPVIKTARLVLRDIGVDDITPEYVAWLNDPQVTRYLEIKWERQTKKKVIDYVRAKLKDTTNTKHFGVYDQGGTRLVGTVTLPNIDRHHFFADVSFVIGHPQARGKGYATEAVQAVVCYVFQYCGLQKIGAGYYDGHRASARVLEKIGFKVEGRLEKKLVNEHNQRVDHILVGLLAENYFQNGLKNGVVKDAVALRVR